VQLANAGHSMHRTDPELVQIESKQHAQHDTSTMTDIRHAYSIGERRPLDALASCRKMSNLITAQCRGPNGERPLAYFESQRMKQTSDEKICWQITHYQTS